MRIDLAPFEHSVSDWFHSTGAYVSLNATNVIGIIQIVVGIVGTSVAGYLVAKQIKIMKSQSGLMEQQNSIAARELLIVENQNKLLAQKAHLTAFSNPDKVNSLIDFVYENLSLSVHNFGERTASEFRILIGYPKGYVFNAEREGWTKLENKRFTGRIGRYEFIQKEFKMNVYPDETVQFATVQLAPYVANRPKEIDVPILFSITYADGRHPIEDYIYHLAPYRAIRAEELPTTKSWTA